MIDEKAPQVRSALQHGMLQTRVMVKASLAMCIEKWKSWSYQKALPSMRRGSFFSFYLVATRGFACEHLVRFIKKKIRSQNRPLHVGTVLLEGQLAVPIQPRSANTLQLPKTGAVRVEPRTTTSFDIFFFVFVFCRKRCGKAGVTRVEKTRPADAMRKTPGGYM